MLISPAFAQAPATGPGGFDMNLIFIGIMIAFMFLFIIRPQMKRAKEHKAMVDSLQKGDEVVTAGGVLGRVTKVTEAYVTVEVASNVELSVQKAAVQTLLPKGTLKSVQ